MHIVSNSNMNHKGRTIRVFGAATKQRVQARFRTRIISDFSR
jgi:hypothetical protein